ncbi:MAG: hypothetical protein HQ512_15295 [Rhodospirillales bacterium]|nr:hypothetical protein [Rhodospirillales bacterium]
MVRSFLIAPIVRGRYARLMRFLVLTLIALITALPATVTPAGAKTIFRAECGDLQGQRVHMDPSGKHRAEEWKPEFYRAGPPPQGQGTLTFLSDDADTGHVRMKWTANTEQLLPVVFKSDLQISLADVDEFGVWIFTLLYRADKIMVTRQTANPGPGVIGALLVGDCVFKEK